jgi:hypothetical protein
MMSNTNSKKFYISSAEKPFFIEKGLYSGLKEKNGLPSPLPISLKAQQEYTGTGYLDTLPHGFLNQTNLKNIIFQATVSGPAIVSFYILLENKKIYHFQDFPLEHGANDISLPTGLINEPNGRLIMFKIKALDEAITLSNWAYLNRETPEYLQKAKETKIVSRSFGESRSIIEQFHRLNQEYQQIAKNFPDCFLSPFPSVVIYESDKTAYIQSTALIKQLSLDFVRLKYNKFNLGGGGNMSVVVQEEIISKANCNQFIMIDSDTIIPFRTLYFSLATAAYQATQKISVATVPTILYAKNPNIILESGALFGRGNWAVASSSPSQPCIAPFFHNRSLTDKDTQSSISIEGYTDYPPFIYSLYTAASSEEKINFLPAPFFLRGDDIEMGLHLREKNIPCQVNGWLVVFQEPKHSLWHEFMAILHGTCLILAQNKKKRLVKHDDHLTGLRDYFTARINCHSQAKDLAGLSVYNEVLSRLINLLDWSDEEVIINFHDPGFYLEMRKLNSGYSSANFKTIQTLKENGSFDPTLVADIPFLYFDKELRDYKDRVNAKPAQIAFINQSNKTAQIIDTDEVTRSSVQELRSTMFTNLEFILENTEALASKCRIICDRRLTQDSYLSQFIVKGKSAKSSLPSGSA